MCCVFHYLVYVFHLIKFVSFCCYRIFLVNKDIQIRAKLMSVSPTVIYAYATRFTVISRTRCVSAT